MPIQYETAEPQDLNEIFLVVQSAIQKMKEQKIDQWDDIYPTREDFLEDIRKKQLRIGRMDGKIAVIYTISEECDEQYQNGIWKEPERPFCILHRLCVNPAVQHQGIAQRTMKRIEEEAEAMGYEAIRLDCFSGNPIACRLYQRLGYQKAGEASWRKGIFWLMEKYLKGA